MRLSHQNRFPIVFQLVNRLVHIGQRGVARLLFVAIVHTRIPAAREFFERRDVEISVVKVFFQRRHVVGHKAAVLANRIAAHR